MCAHQGLRWALHAVPLADTRVGPYRDWARALGDGGADFIDVLCDNLRDMDLDPEEFEFYVAGFRHGVPPHTGWGLGVERILMVLTGAKNVRETVLFPRDRRRVCP